MMTNNDVEVIVIGGGAAGVAAARRLHDASVRCLILEARARLGGRAWTITDASGFALDVGCGWLHSADRNPWARIALELGATIDETPPPWMRPPLTNGFPRVDHAAYREALNRFYARLHKAAQHDTDAAASTLLEPGSRWNGLINAVSTYASGAELDRVSVKDLDRYDDSGINWRVFEGYGFVVSAYGAGLAVKFDCPVRGIDRSGKRLLVDTPQGAIAADQVIVTVPSTVLALERIAFTPALPAKIAAAQALPLGLDDKLFLSLDDAEEFDKDVRMFGRTDSAATAGYHFRPFGRPMIEAYFGGTLAIDLEKGGAHAFFDFATAELVNHLGSHFARRIKPIGGHHWGRDPFSLGSYSYASPGFADCRQTLAEPVENRLFFAGEACSSHDFSTAHGAWQTGVAAAEQVIAARSR
jgi:monoamine oxidase